MLFDKPYIIAEIGSNHNGDMGLAKEMIEQAKECGVDAVKFQSWSPETLICSEEYERNTSYSDGHRHFGTLREMCEKYYLRSEQHLELSDVADKVGVDFVSSAFSYNEIKLLDDLGVPFHKIASMDINNTDLLIDFAIRDKPILLSTGMSTLADIDNAIRVLRRAGNNEIVILHCVALYPCPSNLLNLKMIPTLANTFGCQVGFSDHSIGSHAAVAAVALGAMVIEKHFTLDKTMTGWDHHMSADVNEMTELCVRCRETYSALGTGRRVLSDPELEKKSYFRRSLVTTISIRKGTRLLPSHLTSKRPGLGIPPDQKKLVVGCRVLRDLDQDVMVRWVDVMDTDNFSQRETT